jgi:hypothetical protein
MRHFHCRCGSKECEYKKIEFVETTIKYCGPITIPDVPVTECSNCKERYYGIESDEAINNYLNSNKC